MSTMKAVSLALVIACSSIATAGSAAETPVQTVSFSILEQPLGEALRKFGQQAGLQVVVYSEVSKGRMAPRVEGRLTVDRALGKLLANSGLRYEYLNPRTVAVLPEGQENIGRLGAEAAALRLAQGGERADSAPAVAGQGGQAESSARKSEASEGEAVEEVIVTAQKRAERLLDVPQSVSVVSTDSLARQGIFQFRDYADRIPGLSYTTQGAGYTQVSLRGVTLGQDISPTVAIYLDEVPYGSSTAYAGGPWTALDVGLANLERIEVLKGPQGTLYGASTIGGVIKYVTKKPDSTRFSGDVQAGVSSVHDGGVNYDLAAAVNLPLVNDKLALRVSGFESHDGGYVDNVLLGKEDVNRADIYGGRVDLLYTPTDSLSIRLSGFAQNIFRDGMTQVDYDYTGATAYGELAQRRRIGEPFTGSFRLASGTVTWDMGPATLTSISAYQISKPMIGADLSELYVPLLARFGRTYSTVRLDSLYPTDKWTQELRFASGSTGTFEWIAGAFYAREDSSIDGTFALTDAAGQPATNDVYLGHNPTLYEEYAGFGDLTWHLTAKFDVTGGVRYATHRLRLTQGGSGLLVASRPTIRSDDQVATYLASARYRFTEHATGYVRYATGYRPGGPNYVTIDTTTGRPVAPDSYDSDSLASYEIGFRNESADRRFALDVAGYFIDWSDIQLVGTRNGISIRTNAGGATVTGVEASLTARPLRGLTMIGSVNYQDAHLDDATPDISGAKDERLPNSPDLMASLSADYVLGTASWRPSIGLTARHISERTSGYDAGTGARKQYHLPAYSMLDVRGGFTLNAVDFQLYVRNVLDKRAQLSAYTTYGPPLVTVAQPRTIGLMATMSF